MDRPVRRMISLPLQSDAVAFLNEEEKLWCWIGEGVRHNYNQINSVADRYRPENWISRFRAELDQNNQEAFQQLMRQRYDNNQCLCSIDLEAHAIRALGETDGRTGLVALATVHGEAPTSDQNFLREVRNRIGTAHGNSLLAGIDPSILAGSNRALMDAHGSIELAAQRMRALIEDYKKISSESHEEIRAAAHTLGAAHEDAFTKSEADRAAQYEKLRTDLEATTRAFETRMELQAPVAYWRKRSREYRTASNWALFILIVFSVLSVLGLYYIYERAAAHLPTDSTTVPYAALFRASIFALLMTSIVFWAGRVILRIYLSARHLATDAEERRTMITTFLALTRKSTVNDEDRKFILAALFRPSADGIVKDESAPDTMFAALMGSVLKK
jgi:hypothetical protein